MCSVGDEECERVVETKIVDRDDNCRKCQKKSSIKLRGSDNYCNDCFQAYATHKFRATLGKSKLVRPRDKILVGFSGSAGSVALLNLIRAGMQGNVHKRLVFETQVLFIDDCLKQKTNLEKKSTIESVKNLIEPFGFPGYVTYLPEIYNTEPQIHKLDSEFDHNSASEENKLKSLFEALTNETAKRELLKKLRLRLLSLAAKKLQCSKVFLADGATDLAVDILSNVAVGRGAQLSLDVGFVDDRFEGLMILRPMRDFTRQELDYYLELHRLKALESEKKVKNNPFGSIQQLTEDFVLDLESQFTGTVSTVFRTGAKICSEGFADKEQEICSLCSAPIDTRPQGGATAIQATEFSRFISTHGVRGDIGINGTENGDCEEENCGGCKGDCGNKEPKLTVEQLRRFLCYGCRLIVNDGFDVGKLPGNVTGKAVELVCLEDMREQIKDFLL